MNKVENIVTKGEIFGFSNLIPIIVTMFSQCFQMVSAAKASERWYLYVEKVSSFHLNYDFLIVIKVILLG